MHPFKRFEKGNINILQMSQLPATAIVTIPTTITVHLGRPDEDAENVTVPYLEYIKNVGSSELYPTWPENALRANIHAITSVAMNRIFTEWYRARGYDFDITNSTQYDQAFVPNRGIFDTIGVIVDEIFTQYIVREGQIQPLFAQFCDGRISQCDGLQQWGTVELAEAGFTPIEILRYYYGEDVNIVTNAQVGYVTVSYPGTPIVLGDSSLDVLTIQISLDRIRLNYPALPRIELISGYFDESTEAAVMAFQSVFNLPVTGIVDQSTWYMIRNIYVAVTRLAELTAQGITLSQLTGITRETYLEGDIRPRVDLIQYALNVLSAYYPSIHQVAITGIFDEQTRQSVIEFQETVNLNPTGVVDSATFDALTASLFGILDTLPPEAIYLPTMRWPGIIFYPGDENPNIYIIQEMLSYISLVIPAIPYIVPNGVLDADTQQAVSTFQSIEGLEPTGIIDEETWNSIVDVYRQQRYGTVSGIPPV